MLSISSSKEKTKLSLDETQSVCEYPNVYLEDLLDFNPEESG